jgi:hypothetical protein
MRYKARHFTIHGILIFYTDPHTQVLVTTEWHVFALQKEETSSRYGSSYEYIEKAVADSRQVVVL